MSLVGENIKKIRQVKRLSQAEFAVLFDLARPSIGAYEEGRSEPKIDTIIRIANYFRISIDALLKRKLTVKDIYRLDQVKDALDRAHNGKKDEVPAEPYSPSQGIPFITIQTYVDYIVNHNRADFIKALPRISLPVPLTKKLRAFEVEGSEMEYHQQGIHHGDIVVARMMELKELKTCLGKSMIVVVEEGILIRRLYELNKDDLVLKSDDPNYPTLEIPKKRLLECFLIQSVFSNYLNPPTLLEERVLRLENEIDRIKNSGKKKS